MPPLVHLENMHVSCRRGPGGNPYPVKPRSSMFHVEHAEPHSRRLYANGQGVTSPHPAWPIGVSVATPHGSHRLRPSYVWGGMYHAGAAPAATTVPLR